MADYSALYFTVKKYIQKETDDESIIQIALRLTPPDGLLYLNGASASAISTEASLVIEDSVLGNINIFISALVTKELIPGDYSYDLELVTTSPTVSTLAEGTFTVITDVTRSVS